MSPRLALPAFLVLVLGGGLLIGAVNAPGTWYQQLAKPGFTPPGWVFGPAWTVLYILIGIAGWRTWQRNRNALPMKLWWAQLALNFLWSPVFFSAHWIGAALGVIVLMLASIVGFIFATWKSDRAAAGMFVPYAAWVSFATTLNASIFTLN
jgi:benzodiazapine receptor